MVSRVLYRPFEETDFDVVAAILQPLWHSQSSSDAYNFIEACHDLAHCLSVSTFSQVAIVDDRVLGIVLARMGSVDTNASKRWKRAEHDFRTQLHVLNAYEAARYFGMFDKMNRVDALLHQSAAQNDSEITLLAVDASARGMGTGSVLLDAATAHISANGGTSAYLYTDTDCSYSFYERRGFRRRAAHRSTLDERKAQLPREMYLYTLDLSA